MITIKNYTAESKKIDFAKLPKKFSEGHDFTKDALDLYNEDEDIKEAIDAYVASLNKELPKISQDKKQSRQKKKASVPNPLGLKAVLDELDGKYEVDGLFKEKITVQVIKDRHLDDKLYLKVDGEYVGLCKCDKRSFIKEDIDWIIDIFKKPVAERLFIGLKQEGMIRSTLLEIPREAFSNLTIARKWRNKVAMTLHGAYAITEEEKALKALNDLYDQMTQNMVEDKKKAQAKQERKKKPQARKLSDVLENEKGRNYESAKKAIDRTTKSNKDEKVKMVTYPSEIVKFVKRFIPLTKRYVDKKRLLNLLQAINKSAAEKKIRKKDEGANEIIKIQKALNKELIEAKGKTTAKVDIPESWLNDLVAIAGGEKVFASIPLMKRFIGLTGSKWEKEKGKRLLSSIKNAEDKGKIPHTDPYKSRVNWMKLQLEKAIKDNKLSPTTEALQGLQGVCKCFSNNNDGLEGLDLMDITIAEIGADGVGETYEPSNEEPKLPLVQGLMSAKELAQMEFDTLDFTGEWADIMQAPASKFVAAVYGNPKNGKTSFSTKFANYLSRFGNVLYNLADNGITESSKRIIKEQGLDKNEGIDVLGSKNIDDLRKVLDTGKYKFVFIDLVTNYDWSASEYEKFVKDDYPDISFIGVMETTKDGEFRGEQKWMHLVDQIIRVHEFMAHSNGRYGGGEMEVWKAYWDNKRKEEEQKTEPVTA